MNESRLIENAVDDERKVLEEGRGGSLYNRSSNGLAHIFGTYL